MTTNKRFVVDTNILVSALLIKKSSAWQAITIIESMGTLLYSESTLLELQQVLNRQKFNKYLTLEARQNFLVKFIQKSELVTVTETITDCRDPKDNKFLELAVSGNADFLITGDLDLLVLNPFRTIQIITIKEFLSKISEQNLDLL